MQHPSSTRTKERIAIVGVGGIFPGALDLDSFWNNIALGVDSGRSVPPGRWFLRSEKAFDPDGPKPDRVYSSWGCFIEGFDFDPTGLDLDSQLLSRLDPLFHLGLHAARAAFNDARRLREADPGRVGVILGNIVLPTESTSALCRDILGRTLFERLRESIPLSEEQRGKLRFDNETGSHRRDWHPQNRLAASLPAGLIAKGLGLGGVCYTLDAACASSLYALKFACEELLSHRADAMLAGGMSRPDCQYTQMGFAQLKALSRRGRCAPLSAEADGLVVGEGAGVFVLKRLSDAISAGDPIYAVIAGIGLSNDRGANLLAPHSEGQLRAMRAAYQQAGWRPSDVDLIECHATGTSVGDGVEIDSLHQLWSEENSRPGQCVIGGVKSNVGHLLTGAGAAGLMKVLYSLRHKTLPPTANYEKPAAGLLKAESPFRVLAQAEPWARRHHISPTGHSNQEPPIPMRATVNAFGFGGINAHLLIEEFLETDRSHSAVVPAGPGLTRISAGPRDLRNGPGQVTTEESEQLNIAVVGLAVLTSRSPSIDEGFLRDFCLGDTPLSPPIQNDWGVHQTDWYRRTKPNSRTKPVTFSALPLVQMRLGEFRIPPLEMQDMLPQQQLMLKVAAAALKDFESGHGNRVDPADNGSLGNRTGVFVGIELDPNTTNFHLRWSVEEEASAWAESIGLAMTPDELAAWIVRLKDAVGPPLTANRVMGNLGGIVASRLAREFNVGGPSFTISSDEHSGLRACELAAHALRRGELDQALVGAVDLPCDVRSQVAIARDLDSCCSESIMDGATAVVLKRWEDAVRDGDRIHAVISRFNEATCAARSLTNPGADVIRLAPSVQSFGAATGLLTLAAAVISLRDRILPGTPPSYWLMNRRDGSRRIVIPGRGNDGKNSVVELMEPQARTPVVAGSVVADSPHQTAAGRLAAGLFVIDGNSSDELALGLQQLAEQADSVASVDRLARTWFRKRPPRSDCPMAIAIVVKSCEELRILIRSARDRLRQETAATDLDRRIAFTRQPLGITGRLSFVFPGSGNAFLGMGRELLTAFPGILRHQEAENEWLRNQYRPELIWSGRSTAALLEDHKAMIFGQVALGTAICDLLTRFGVRPSASIGYSLGESAALFGLRAWTDRDEMLARMDAASLFGSDLVYPFHAARRAWTISEGSEVPWVSGTVDRSASEIRQAIANLAVNHGDEVRSPRVYLLIVNTPNQCVIGGDRTQVNRLVSNVSATFVPFAAPSTVHCEVLRQVEPAYRQLHVMQTTAVTSQVGPVSSEARPIDFYSTAWSRSYQLTQESAADAIVAQAVETIDFPKVIERAYADGVRLFVEIGPGSSCTRMIDEILGERPHLAQSVTPATANPTEAFLESLAALISHRISVDLSYLYGNESDPSHDFETIGSTREVVTIVGGGVYQIPNPPGGWKLRLPEEKASDAQHATAKPIVPIANSFDTPAAAGAKPGSVLPQNESGLDLNIATARGEPDADRLPLDSLGTNLMTQLDDFIAARAKAHETYLRVSSETHRIMAEQLERLSRISGSESSETSVEGVVLEPQPIPIDSEQNALSEGTHHGERTNSGESRSRIPGPVLPAKIRAAATEQSTLPPIGSVPPRSLSRRECMEFAIGKIGRVLGERFAAIDQYPTRVRLPDEPLMLVDRILEIEGEPLSMADGRVVTEHDIFPEAWYLDCGRIPTCIAVEAGQADLFLSGWLGIDFETKGVASYRLLDAVVTFHRELPGAGQTIHYDIRINHFFRQGQTYLFRFEFDATVDGQPLLTMREGCAGFFTPAELAGGKGIIHTALDRQPRPGKRPADWKELVPMEVEIYGDSQLLALRQGQLEICFGPHFAGLPVINPVTLPGLSLNGSRSRMWLIDRVLKLEPHGGKFGLGTILGELDIHADDWFITCHFCDDQVMPGTLMYECCMHTLRIFLLRMGWVGEAGQIAYEPIPGIRSRLKCRGQVLATTKKVWYEITVKEIGYSESGGSTSGQVPFCLADALMYADGKPIVEITDMSVRLSGLTREAAERIWLQRQPHPSTLLAPASTKSPIVIHRPYDRRAALFDTDRITAFAIGNPSDAFGDRYRAFDSERIIARLPGPPFQFLDRIVAISGCQPWILQPGGEVVAQYDIPPDAWYFASNRQKGMPFAVLLETALQPCGWLAAYVGSALTSEIDLSFRNLGGTATQFREVTAASGTLTTTVKMTKVSNSGGMIIQHYDFDLRCDGEPVYVGNTYFGFFSKASLTHQIGIRDAKPFEPSSAETSRAHRFPYIDAAPFADSRFQMIDDVQLSLTDGPYDHGFAIGTTVVDATSWFFKAHFHQDPVVPGSLGLESFFQLVKLYASQRWNLAANAQFLTPLLGRKHEWVYRGQVVPTDKRVTVSAVIKNVDDGTHELSAEGFLSIDGRIIYQMKEFSLGIVR